MSGGEEARVTQKYLAALDRAWEDYEKTAAAAADKRERLIALAYAEYRGSLALLAGIPVR